MFVLNDYTVVSAVAYVEFACCIAVLDIVLVFHDNGLAQLSSRRCLQHASSSLKRLSIVILRDSNHLVIEYLHCKDESGVRPKDKRRCRKEYDTSFPLKSRRTRLTGSSETFSRVSNRLSKSCNFFSMMIWFDRCDWCDCLSPVI